MLTANPHLSQRVIDMPSNRNPFDQANRIPTIPIRYMMRYDEIDRIIKGNFTGLGESSTVTLFIDTRSTMPSVFTKAGMTDMVESYIKTGDKFVYTRTMIKLINHWCRYFRREGIGYNIVLFSEEGESAYHARLSRDYKLKRGLAKLKKLS